MRIPMLALAIILLMADSALHLATPVHAQSSINGFVILGTATSVSGCSWSANATVTNGLAICPLNLSGTPGIALAVNGGAFTQVSAPQNGVSTFNGRSGNVLPLANDYSYAQLSSPPTTITCTTATHSNTGLNASGCLIK